MTQQELLSSMSKEAMHDHYGHPVREISAWSDISPDAAFHYIYTTRCAPLHFFYRQVPESRGLMVVFHGARRKLDHGLTPLPIFLYNSFQYSGISVLCISDPMLQVYESEELLLSWFSASKKINVTAEITELLSAVSALEGSQNILTFGSSGGAFPAIKFAGILGKRALVSNGQYFLDKHPLYTDLTTKLAKYGDSLCESPDITQILEKSGFPTKIHMFMNTEDTYTYEKHALPFVQYMRESGRSSHLEFNAFTGQVPEPNKRPHHVLWPCLETYKDLIRSYVLSDHVAGKRSHCPS